MSLHSPLSNTNRAYKLYAKRLEKLNIFIPLDLLYHVPSRYENFTLVSKIETLQAGEVATIIGTVDEMKNVYTSRFKKLQTAVIHDDTGKLQVMWFNQPFLTKSIHPGDTIALSGRTEKSRNTVTLLSPEYEVLTNGKKGIHTGRLVPIYPETKGVSSKWLRRQIHTLLEQSREEVKDFLPEDLLRAQNLPDLFTALQHIHFPEHEEQARVARQRLAFEELFLLQLNALKHRSEWKKSKTGNHIIVEKEKFHELLESLPFSLTSAQEKAIEEIFLDIQQREPMNRLLQGDVGSGKTVVAAVIMFTAFLNGYQSVLMAPTEILAQQHYSTIKRLLEPFGVKVDIATSNQKSIKYEEESIKRKKKEKNLNTHILIGTHAVLRDDIRFTNLGLIVIDEQQRFGVEQRAILRNKGNNPHVLSMTATPIPRTIALTMYGNLDISYLNEMPKGRREIKTWLVPAVKRDGAYEWIRKQVKETDSQIFIICPFIEESENMLTIKAAQKEFERLKKNVFPDLNIGLLHGKLKPKEKDQVLQDFREKKFAILVATPVVEVGIDIPNATVIVIEAADRFGLAQLHQLRGRVGRGHKQSYCLLFTESKNMQTIERLKAMETIHKGNELAELDLKLRGSGDMYGTQQSGFKLLKIATFSDQTLLLRARHEAQKIFNDLEKYPLLLEKLQQLHDKQVAPD